MIKITVEILPNGDEQNKKTVGTMEIVNDGTGNDLLGNYYFQMNVDTPTGFERFQRNKVKRFNRTRGFWSLIKECLGKVQTDHRFEIQ